jgi:hypothetical protein
MSRGRKPGYKHLEETKAKISQSMTGRTKTEEHKNQIAVSMYDLEGKCLARLEELRANYPEQQSFFDENEAELLFAMRDVRTEKELNDIRRFLETKELSRIRENQRSYQYSSSSYHAAEDAMIALIDFKRLLPTYH